MLLVNENGQPFIFLVHTLNPPIAFSTKLLSMGGKGRGTERIFFSQSNKTWEKLYFNDISGRFRENPNCTIGNPIPAYTIKFELNSSPGEHVVFSVTM